MSAGWSWAFDTPFDWFKQNASAGRHPAEHGGVLARGITDKGGLREQFMHVIDVVPTILEVTGIRRPEVDGIKQAPIEGTSFAYTFDAANADAPSPAHHPVLRDDGPVGALPRGLAAQHQGQPRAVGGLRTGQPRPAQQPGVRALRPDQGLHQSNDIAEQHPDKVKELRALFIEEAKKYQVFPLDASVAARLVAPSRTSPPAGPSSSTPAHDRPAPGRLAAAAEHLLHHHRGHRRARRAAPRA
jgi:arylsulfatase A-like enzyme